jgi:hypothetical protein
MVILTFLTLLPFSTLLPYLIPYLVHIKIIGLHSENEKSPRRLHFFAEVAVGGKKFKN